jgi:pyruvate dehydrogenase E1 component alpha subunit
MRVHRRFSDDFKTEIYSQLYLIRRAEEKVADIYPTDKIKSPVHLSIGQESIAVGICTALEEGDPVSGTYRGHATYLARGGSLPGMFAELYGKDTGVARGKGGSMHLVAMDKMILGTSAVVGSTIPVAVGVAMAQKALKTGKVTVVFFGDGATEEGVFYESLNFAALKTLPILFVCENNGLAIHEPISKRQAANRLTERVSTYGIPSVKVESGDVFDVYGAASELVAGIRAGGGPAFMECMTYRWREHVGPGEDYDSGYRTRADLEPWLAADSLVKLAAELPAADRTAIEADIDAQIEAAVQLAEQSPEPDLQELFSHVYA